MFKVCKQLGVDVCTGKSPNAPLIPERVLGVSRLFLHGILLRRRGLTVFAGAHRWSARKGSSVTNLQTEAGLQLAEGVRQFGTGEDLAGPFEAFWAAFGGRLSSGASLF